MFDVAVYVVYSVVVTGVDDGVVDVGDVDGDGVGAGCMAGVAGYCVV